MIRWSGELTCERMDEWTVAYAHPRAVFVLVTQWEQWRGVGPRRFFTEVMGRFGYRFVRHEACLQAEVWAIWWMAPFARVWDRIADAFYKGLCLLLRGGLLVMRDGVPWGQARPNCWPWRGKGGRIGWRRQSA